MMVSKNSLAIAAALAGLVGGTAARATQLTPSTDTGVFAGTMAADKKVEKHACKGLNSCKGNGGGDKKKECGKNECKGQGAFATDGSKPKKM